MDPSCLGGSLMRLYTSVTISADTGVEVSWIQRQVKNFKVKNEIKENIQLIPITNYIHYRSLHNTISQKKIALEKSPTRRLFLKLILPKPRYVLVTFIIAEMPKEGWPWSIFTPDVCVFTRCEHSKIIPNIVSPVILKNHLKFPYILYETGI